MLQVSMGDGNHLPSGVRECFDAVCFSRSIACDLHLHILGLFIVVLSPNETFRKRIIQVLFVIGVIVPAWEIYFRDLDGNFLVVGDALRSYMVHVPTFTYMYVRTHTNMPTFLIGMYLGYTIEEYEKIKIHPKVKKIQEYLGVVALSIMLGFILYLVIEAPFSQTFKLIFFGRKPKASLKTNDNTNGVYSNGKSVHVNGKFREELTYTKPIKTE
ncbi:unnamed protein product [Diatraea saccharalis]|uniref:Uncharacterized protein n=1 Tax=Diatraea saccharalis TaxID=40085 RepID=A0A9N9RFY3_9NEOP|nr:unnamed protein product [Diatraea saccharalis]